MCLKKQFLHDITPSRPFTQSELARVRHKERLEAQAIWKRNWALLTHHIDVCAPRNKGALKEVGTYANPQEEEHV